MEPKQPSRVKRNTQKLLNCVSLKVGFLQVVGLGTVIVEEHGDGIADPLVLCHGAFHASIDDKLSWDWKRTTDHNFYMRKFFLCDIGDRACPSPAVLCDTPSPTPAPTTQPTPAPTAQPTPAPSPAPTSNPTSAPTNEPSPTPSNEPTPAPSNIPTQAPTNNPAPSKAPSSITLSPSSAPQSPTLNPTKAQQQGGDALADPFVFDQRGLDSDPDEDMSYKWVMMKCIFVLIVGLVLCLIHVTLCKRTHHRYHAPPDQDSC